VYVGMAAELLHEGHINILKEASKHGKVIVGLLTDEAIASYKEFPILPFEKRKSVVSAIRFVDEVIPQNTLDYTSNISLLKPDFLFHGDDWKNGPQKETRTRVIELLQTYGGKLVEFPYTQGISSSEIKKRIQQVHAESSRGSSLRRLISKQEDILRFIDLHSALSGLIAEALVVERGNQKVCFDGMWASSLTDATSRGKPDIEVVDVSSRILSLQDVLEATSKPIIFDGDTGGLPEHFAYTVKSLERNEISAVIIEDKLGLKKNSLLERDNAFLQEDVKDFAAKIKSGVEAKVSPHFMVIARIESLILGKGEKDALERAHRYVEAGADGIMIHSRQADGRDFIGAVEKFRKDDQSTPLIAVPTSFGHIKDRQLWDMGVNIVIYANHLLRASYPAMKMVAETILKNGSADTVEGQIMTMKEILNLIPGTN